jgi:tetratricopeptide (TPR) repeat protein/tRNA A-37 threonylcarbamoyl transferase component Bud32
MDESNRRASQLSSRSLASLRESFAQQWQEGRTPSLAQFLNEAPELDRVLLFRALLGVELQWRRQRGEQPTCGEYLEQFPDAADVIGEVFSPHHDTLVTGLDAMATTMLANDSRGAQESSTLSHVGDYEILHEIARGGMGVVYKARQTSLNRLVALKMILTGQFASPEDIRRFRMEAGSAAQLDHPGIVPIFEIGEHQGQPYFSMGLVEGNSLAARIAEGPLAPREAAQFVATIAEAVAYAHQRGVIHRDLKPGNVLIDQHGTPKVTDFGLAKRVDGESNLTGTGDVLGTPSYMPPEQASGELDKIGPSADIYALGAILYCLLTARPPFQAARSLDTLLQVIAQEPVSPGQLNPAVDKDLETICLKCLEKSPERRYATAVALGADLNRFLNDEPIHARRIGSAAKLGRWCRRKPLIAGLVAAVGVSVIAGVSLSTYFAIVAARRAEQAENGTAIALSTLETMIKDVQEQLRPIPAARDIRRKLLRSSLADLQRVSGEFRSQRRVDRNTARALVDLADLFYEVGDDEGLDATNAAETNFRTAVEIYRELHEAQPTDPLLTHEFSAALNALGNFYLMGDRLNVAKEPLFEALKLGRELPKTLPDHASYCVSFSWILSNCGDLYAMQSQFRKSLPFFNEAEQLVRRLLAAEPNNLNYQRRLAECLEKAGDAHHDLGENDEAFARFQTSLKISEKLHQSDPESTFFVESMAFAHERLGNHWLQVGDAKQAREAYRKMLDFTKQAIVLDPDSRPLQDGLAICYDKIAQVNVRLGDQQAAQTARREAGEIRRRLKGTGK